MTEYKQLEWTDFGVHLSNTVFDLLADDTFSDVTLISDDNKPFKAHKVILAAISTVFRNMLMTTSTGLSAVIILNGVESSELESLIEFIYQGKTNIPEESLQQFLNIAKTFDISGLYEEQSSEEDPTEGNTVDFKGKDEHKIELDVDVKDGVVISENLFTCEICPYTAMKIVKLRKHMKITHGEARFFCDLCDFKTTRKEMLKAHKLSGKHQQNVLFCEKCDFKSQLQSDLDTHVNSHKYPCNECSYNGTRKSHLKRHIEGQHLGIKYKCNYCEYSGKTLAYLKVHEQSMHGNISYSCENCSFNSKHPSAFRRHMLMIHSSMK